MLGKIGDHVGRTWTVTHSPLQRSIAAKAAPSLAELTSLKPASSAHTKELDGSKDKSDEEWQKMVEDGDLTVQSYMVRIPLPVLPPLSRSRSAPAALNPRGRFARCCGARRRSPATW